MKLGLDEEFNDEMEEEADEDKFVGKKSKHNKGKNDKEEDDDEDGVEEEVTDDKKKLFKEKI